MKRAIFPDAQSLQPLPANVHPNISGNVNSTTQINPEENKSPIQNASNNVAPVEVKITTKNTPLYYILWSVILFFIVLIIILIYKKLRSRN